MARVTVLSRRSSQKKPKDNTCTFVMSLGLPAPVVVLERLDLLPGLRRVRLDSVQSSLWVDYDPEKVTASQIRHACARPGSDILTV